MEFIINKNVFFHILSFLQNITEKKTTIPILSNCIIKTQKAKLIVLGTDLETTVVAKTGNVNILKEGEISVPSRIFYYIVKELPNTDIKVKLNDKERVILECKSSVYNISCMDPKDFPYVENDVENYVEINAENFIKSIRSVSFCMSNDSSKSYLNCLCIKLDKERGYVDFVATDDHRLAIKREKIDSLIKKTDKDNFYKVFDTITLVPKKAVNELFSVLTLVDRFEFGKNDKLMSFKTQTVDLMSRVLDYDYPDWSFILDIDWIYNFSVDKKELVEAIRRLVLFCDNSFAIVFKVFKDHIMLYSFNKDFGLGCETVSVDFKDFDQSFSFVLNGRYVLDFLSRIDSDEVKIFYKKEDVSIKFVDVENEMFEYYVMPLDVQIPSNFS